MTQASDPALQKAASPPSENRRVTQADTLTSAGLTYVWEWWKFHAKQRTDMFNYFLIITGILANAYVQLLKTPQPRLSMGLGAVGLIASLGFLLLDIRNTNQLERATTLLQEIESAELFQEGKSLARTRDFWLIRHRFVFRAVEVLLALGWLLIILWG